MNKDQQIKNLKNKLSKLKTKAKKLHLELEHLEDKLCSLQNKLSDTYDKIELIKSGLFVGAHVACEYRDVGGSENDCTIYGKLLNIKDCNYCEVKFNNGMLFTVDISQLNLISKKKYLKQISK